MPDITTSLLSLFEQYPVADYLCSRQFHNFDCELVVDSADLYTVHVQLVGTVQEGPGRVFLVLPVAEALGGSAAFATGVSVVVNSPQWLAVPVVA